MKIENRKREVSDTFYIAVDGTEFDSEKECIEYEKTAKCCIMSRLRNMASKVVPEDYVFDIGNCENEVYICTPKSSKDVDYIRQVLALYNNNHDAERVSDNSINHVVLITIAYDYAWYTTLDSIIENIVGKGAKIVYNN